MSDFSFYVRRNQSKFGIHEFKNHLFLKAFFILKFKKALKKRPDGCPVQKFEQ